ncbi:hypothetical protein GJ744_007213 [Endocarpon pusillum]|uniref:Uncharacterized protein n=1 Tax=Endocarpon pusillum TaxID=364733 RepID=A0A8H7DZ45_9EURO|nr:hypothetical protein GJ744_007213 [Endocarpon pusillum]
MGWGNAGRARDAQKAKKTSPMFQPEDQSIGLDLGESFFTDIQKRQMNEALAASKHMAPMTGLLQRTSPRQPSAKMTAIYQSESSETRSQEEPTEPGEDDAETKVTPTGRLTRAQAKSPAEAGKPEVRIPAKRGHSRPRGIKK